MGKVQIQDHSGKVNPHDQTQGMVPESEIEERIAEARVGMVPESEIEARIGDADPQTHPSSLIQRQIASEPRLTGVMI